MFLHFVCFLVFAEKKGDKEKGGTPDKGKKGTTLRPASEGAGDESKSPRAATGGAGGGGAGGVGGAGAGGAAVEEEVMVFALGDVRLALTHRKLLHDNAFFDIEYALGGPNAKKSTPTRAHRAIIQIRCPALLQEGKFISKIDKKKPLW